MKTRLTEFFGIEQPIVSAPMALISGGRLAAAVSSSGGLDWPPEYNERALSNPFVDGWHGNEAELLASLPDAVNTFEAAVAAEDFDAAAILIGESIGLIDEVRPAGDIVADMASHAEQSLNQANDFVNGR